MLDWQSTTEYVIEKLNSTCAFHFPTPSKADYNHYKHKKRHKLNKMKMNTKNQVKIL